MADVNQINETSSTPPPQDESPAVLFQFTKSQSRVVQVITAPAKMIGNLVTATRNKTIEVAPDWVVNNSSRIVSGCRVFGDAFFIASGIAGKGIMETIGRSGAGSITIAATALGLVYNEKEQKSEEIAALKEMRTPEYIATRFKQMFDPKDHIRQTLGGSLMTAGMLFCISGASSGRPLECTIGTLVSLAGGALTFTVKNEDAWQRFGGIFSIISITGIAYAADAAINQKDYFIPVAQAGFTLADITAILIGGAKKQTPPVSKQIER